MAARRSLRKCRREPLISEYMCVPRSTVCWERRGSWTRCRDICSRTERASHESALCCGAWKNSRRCSYLPRLTGAPMASIAACRMPLTFRLLPDSYSVAVSKIGKEVDGPIKWYALVVRGDRLESKRQAFSIRHTSHPLPGQSIF